VLAGTEARPTHTEARHRVDFGANAFSPSGLISSVLPVRICKDGCNAPDQAAVVRGWIRFTEKAREEMEADGLAAGEVVESIVNAQAIAKTLRSRSRAKRYPGE
ncbi:MAG: hypothetical protein KAY37_07020, partial [Phycisphaerae bacterium]|nr:hypothetical protein [Phycisphaerae bacterium]